MKKIIVIYKSKYGSTKQYAAWLSKALNADLLEHSNVNINALNNYDTIIYGGGIYATGIKGFSLIKQNFNHIKEKEVIVFAVGASPYEEETLHSIKKNNFTVEMDNVKLFYMQGSFNYDNMKFLDKTLVKMLKKSIDKKPYEELVVWEKALLDGFYNSSDNTNIENINPILDYISSKFKNTSLKID